MIRTRSPAHLDPWLECAKSSLVASFANGVVKDKAAVSAAVALPWSNGQTEGQITKLKLVKRQMYGREISTSCKPALSESPDRSRHQNCVRAKVACRVWSCVRHSICPGRIGSGGWDRSSA